MAMEGDMQEKSKYQNVLFQKIGPEWYAITEGNDGMMFCKLPEGVNPHDHTFDIIEMLEDNQQQKSKDQIKKELALVKSPLRMSK